MLGNFSGLNLIQWDFSPVGIYGLKLVVGASAQIKTIGIDSVGSQSVLYLMNTSQEIVLFKNAFDKFEIKNLFKFKHKNTPMV